MIDGWIIGGFLLTIVELCGFLWLAHLRAKNWKEGYDEMHSITEKCIVELKAQQKAYIDLFDRQKELIRYYSTTGRN